MTNKMMIEKLSNEVKSLQKGLERLRQDINHKEKEKKAKSDSLKEKELELIKLMFEEGLKETEVLKATGLGRATLYRYKRKIKGGLD